MPTAPSAPPASATRCPCRATTATSGLLRECPQSAIIKGADLGLMSIDEEKCIGCGTCAIVCPYNAPKVDEEKKKAVRCKVRRARGRGREAGVRRGLPGSCAGLRRPRRWRRWASAATSLRFPTRPKPPRTSLSRHPRTLSRWAQEIANPLEVA
ncbi:MAG: 4Fe-4S binding protein [Eggerthella lenta]